VPEEKSTSHKLATGVMFKLENGKKDVSKFKLAASIICRLQDHHERWRDDSAANIILCDPFNIK